MLFLVTLPSCVLQAQRAVSALTDIAVTTHTASGLHLLPGVQNSALGLD